ncbi:MAG: sodium/pantothenate symporter [Eubacterium sp.]|nr:sodium/pantothenate symporter [Eubacterium sp.]
MDGFLRMLPVVVFFVALLVMGFMISKKSADAAAKDFSKEYYIGGRSLGGFVLAMTLVATYSSVSSFLSGPGVAWNVGYGWVYYASTQVVAAFLVLGVLGKKMAVVGRKVDAVTVIDMIRARYNSEPLAIILAIVILVFFTTTMLGQFTGGAQIFSGALGIDYKLAMILFAATVIIYTTVGGFNAVAITDTACAIVMLVGMCFLGYAIMSNGGGYTNITNTINEMSATARATGEGNDMLNPYTAAPLGLFVTQWMLCGICTIGLPQSEVRNLSYKNTSAIHSAMIYGTIVVGAMMVGMHWLGVLSRGVLTSIPEGASTDTVVPTLIAQYMHPLVAGLTIVGPLAATMSTISSLLIAGSSAIVKDLYLHHKEAKGEVVDQGFVRKLSIGITFVMGLVAVLLGLNPPSIIVWINMFSFGGLQTSFFCAMLFGLFWKKGNATGALLGVIGGLGVYCVTMAAGWRIWGMHQIMYGVVVSIILYIIGSNIGKPIDDKTGRLFFPEKY